MSTIKISKGQWEFIGKQAGWMKKEVNQNIQQQASFQGIKDRILPYLQKIPGFEQAMSWVNNLRNKSWTLEQFVQETGMQKEHIDAARNFLNKFNITASDAATMRKEALTLDARVIAAIIIIILGIMGVKYMYSAVADLGQMQDNRIQNLEHRIQNP